MAVRRILSGLSLHLPGLSLLVIGALFVRVAAPVLGFNQLLLAIALGFVLANGIDTPAQFDPGIGTHRLWLGAGIVLMGASISLDAVRDAGGFVLLTILVMVGTTLLVVELLSRFAFGLNERLGSLLAAGSSICGVSAIVAVAAAIRPREEQVAYAAATVLLFDAVTIVLYPIIGELLGLSGRVFGIWAGISMFSTGPVVAVGFSHSDVAGRWATITKLARNGLIGVVVVAYASYYARTANGGDGGRGAPSVGAASSTIRTLWNEFPKFVLGFLALAVLSSLDVFSTTQQASLENASDWLFLVAFVGLGTEIRLEELRQTGSTPVFVVLLALLVVSTLSLLVLLLALSPV